MTGFKAEPPYFNLSLLPPARELVETISILRQESRAASALAELKGLSRLMPNPAILINALVLKEAKVSSEI
ncbi:Fic/DOC family N-terminal domain-containing protein [Spirosoma flavus]